MTREKLEKALTLDTKMKHLKIIISGFEDGQLMEGINRLVSNGFFPDYINKVSETLFEKTKKLLTETENEFNNL